MSLRGLLMDSSMRPTVRSPETHTSTLGTPRENESPAGDEQAPPSTAWAETDITNDGPDSEVAAFQELLVYAGSESKPTSGWRDPDNGATGKASYVTAVLERAPASFNTPFKIKREFKPPFLVSVTATYPQPSRIGCKARCYMLNDYQLENLESWRPDFQEEDLLDGREVEGDAWTTAGEGNYEASVKLEFSLLKFLKPTRMTKRYPLFFLELSFGVNLLLIYKKPTVVASRMADQYSKALLVLKGIQPMDGRSLIGKEGAAACAAAATEAAVQRLKKRDAPHDEDEDESDSNYYNASMATDYLIAKINEAGMQRQLSDSDVMLLLELAGFTQYNLPKDPKNPERAATMKRNVVTEHQWEFFKAWFERKFLPAMMAVQSLWDQRTPHAICPLSTTRAMCEPALENAAVGAFCVRARLKVGNPVTWVISCCEAKNPGAPIRHILLMPEHLKLHSLETWVRDLRGLLYCMDLTTGEMVQKERLFNHIKDQKTQGDVRNTDSMPTNVNSYGFGLPMSKGTVYNTKLGHNMADNWLSPNQQGSSGCSLADLSQLKIDPEEGDKAISNWVRTGNYRE